MDSNLFTIVLTLYDREEYTKRWLEWMNYNNCPYLILIADGGKNNNIAEHLKNNTQYQNLEYKYIRYSYDKDFPTFYNKFDDVVRMVTTPYMMLCDNDDFIILDNISKKISFLENNQDYSCCSGEIIRFDLLSKVKNTVTYSLTTNFLQFEILDDVENENPYTRMKKMLENNYANLWYGVIRTEYMKEVTQQIKITNPLVLQTMEYYMFMMLGIFGKIKIFKDVHYARQLYTSQSAVIPFEGDNNILVKLLSESFQNDILKLKKSLHSYLVKDGIIIEKKIFDAEFNIAYEKNISINLKKQLIKIHRDLRIIKNSILKKRHKYISRMIIVFQNITGLKITNLISQNNHKEKACHKIIDFMTESLVKISK